MISEVRNYFDARIKEVDPELVAYLYDVFGNNDVTANQAEKNYNLILGALSTERINQGLSDTMTVTLDLWSSNGTNVQCDFDSLYCKALRIRDGVLKLSNIEQEEEIGQITFGGLEPLEEATNDNVFKMRLNFQVTRFYRL